MVNLGFHIFLAEDALLWPDGPIQTFYIPGEEPEIHFLAQQLWYLPHLGIEGTLTIDGTTYDVHSLRPSIKTEDVPGHLRFTGATRDQMQYAVADPSDRSMRMCNANKLGNELRPPKSEEFLGYLDLLEAARAYMRALDARRVVVVTLT